jgi:hydrogenase maturation protease
MLNAGGNVIKNTETKVHILGYGNVHRQDDGLGPAMVDLLGLRCSCDIRMNKKVQLTIDDTLEISGSEIAVFVDASTGGEGPFTFYEIEPRLDSAFSSNIVTPNTVVSLCEYLYNRKVKAYMLAIRGYSWEYLEDLTPGAAFNQRMAYAFLTEWFSENFGYRIGERCGI